MPGPKVSFIWRFQCSENTIIQFTSVSERFSFPNNSQTTAVNIDLDTKLIRSNSSSSFGKLANMLLRKALDNGEHIVAE